MLCSRTALLVKGKIIATDTPSKLKAMAEEKPAVEVGFKAPLLQAAEQLGQRLPGTVVMKVNDRIRVYGGETAVALETVIKYAREMGTEVASVNSLKPTLEDAFVKLTGLSPLVMAAEKGGK